MYSFDRRSSYERMHVKGDRLPPSISSPTSSTNFYNNNKEKDNNNLDLDPKSLKEEDYAVPDKERLFVDRSTSIPSLVIDPVKEIDAGDYR